MDDLFGDIFDLDNDGEIDDIEKAAEIGFMAEDFGDEDYDDEYDDALKNQTVGK